MNRFIIVDGLPYLYAAGKAYTVRWDEAGFTVGEEVEMTSFPSVTYSELSILAKCADSLDSIGASREEQEDMTLAEPETNEIDPLEDMTLAELKAYAKERGIALNGARSKASIILIIKEQAV